MDDEYPIYHCPCGSGYITEDYFEPNDWVAGYFRHWLRCPICQKMLVLFSGENRDDFFLVSKDYPKYTGPQSFVIRQRFATGGMEFYEELIRAYTRDQLRYARDALARAGSCSRVPDCGVDSWGYQVVLASRRRRGSARVNVLLGELDEALSQYHCYWDNKETRDRLISEAETAERQYRYERYRHAILPRDLVRIDEQDRKKVCPNERC